MRCVLTDLDKIANKLTIIENTQKAIQTKLTQLESKVKLLEFNSSNDMKSIHDSIKKIKRAVNQS